VIKLLNEDQTWNLELTMEEALGLLNLLLLSPEEWTVAQGSAVQKLSEFCRQSLRETERESICL